MKMQHIKTKLSKALTISFVLSLPLFGFALRSEQLSLLRVDEVARQSHARRVLGSGKFDQLVSTAEVQKLQRLGSLENFILKQVEARLPKSSKSLAPQVANAVIREANRYGFDPLFIMAMIQLESRFNPAARGGHGEIGLMQILPKTAKWVSDKNGLGYTNKKQLLDAELNIRIGVAYLAMLDKKFNRVHYSVAAYNMGPKNVRRVLASNSQPKIYYQKVKANYNQLYTELEAASLAREITTNTLVASEGVASVVPTQ